MVKFRNKQLYGSIKNTFSVTLSLFSLGLPALVFAFFYTNFDFSFPIVFLASFLLHLSLLPLIFILNDRNAWSYDFDNHRFGSWLHPRIIKQISLALIYPYVFGIYYSFIRYNRLGSTVNIDLSLLGKYQYLIISTMIILPCTCILFLPYLEKIYSFFNQKRIILWNSTTGLFYSWYIHKLSKDRFFYVIEKIYKLYRLIRKYCIIENPVYWDSTEEIAWYKHVLNFLYLNALNIFYFLTFGGIVLEIFLENRIYYGFYLLFIIPIVRILGTFWKAIANTYLYEPACLADYLYTDWKNLKFPNKFTACVGNSDIIYPITLRPTKEQKVVLKKIQEKHRPEYVPYRPKTKMRIHQEQLIQRVKGHSWGIRFAADYWKYEGKRFFHSSCISRKIPEGRRYFHTNTSLRFPGGANIPPKPSTIVNREYLHPATAAFCRSPMQRVSMYNKDRISYEAIQSVERRLGGTPLHKETFQSSLRPPQPNERSFVLQTEIAGCTYFHYSEQRFGITALRFSKTIPVSFVDPAQKQPDVILDARRSIVEEKRVSPYDNKSGLGLKRTNNIVVSNRNKPQFSDLLDRHRQSMDENNNLTSKNRNVLKELENNYGNVQGQQDALMPNMQHFPNHFQPPLHSPENFYTGWFTPKAQAAYEKAQDTVLSVDDYLITNNIPKPRTKGEWQQFFDTQYSNLNRDLEQKFSSNAFYKKDWSVSDDYL